MKSFLTIIGALTATCALWANSFSVRLEPDAEATVIGELATMSLAVPAEWPQDTAPVQGWQPVFYQGVFEVYVENNDIAKNLNAKPGSPYYLAPEKGATVLSIATDKDKVDILSVDSWYCKMQLETIVLGYVKERTVEASSIVTSLAPPQTAVEQTQDKARAITELLGRLEKTGILGKKRTGTDYKLISTDGKTLAFVEISDLPERIQLSELRDLQVRVSGFLKQRENGTDVILQAKTIKKAN